MLTDFENTLSNIHSQTICFGGDGRSQFAINVPDADDVKGAFSQMAITILTQQSELINVNALVKRMSDDFTRSHFDMMSWAKRNISELREQNAILQQQLLDSQEKLKILSYNINGILEVEDQQQSTINNLIARQASIAPPFIPNLSKEMSTLPGVSQQASLNPTNMSTLTSGLNPAGELSKDSPKEKITEQIKEPVKDSLVQMSTPVSSNPSPRTQGMRTLKQESASISQEDVLRLAPGAVLRFRGSSEYEPNLRVRLQVKGVDSTSMSVARIRWIWAISVVKSCVRMRVIIRNWTKSRLPKGNTINDRLERVESGVQRLAKSIQPQIETMTQGLYLKLHEEVLQSMNSLDQYKLEVTRTVDALRESLSDTHTDMDMRMQQLKSGTGLSPAFLDSANSALMGKVDSETEEKIGKLLKRMDSGALQQTSGLKSTVRDLQERIDELEAVSKTIQQSVLLHSAPDVLASLDNDHSLVKILRYDTELREARERLLVVDSAVSTTIHNVRGLKTDLDLYRDKPDLSEDDLVEYTGFSNQCGSFQRQLNEIVVMMKECYDNCRKFDTVVAKRWQTLSSEPQKLFASVQEAMTQFQVDLTERPTFDRLEQYSSERIQKAVDDAMKEMDDRVNKTLFKLRINIVEQGLAKENRAEKARLGIDDSSADKSEEATNEFEGLLEPLVREMVEMYVEAEEQKQLQEEVRRKSMADAAEVAARKASTASISSVSGIATNGHYDDKFSGQVKPFQTHDSHPHHQHHDGLSHHGDIHSVYSQESVVSSLANTPRSSVSTEVRYPHKGGDQQLPEEAYEAMQEQADGKAPKRKRRYNLKRPGVDPSELKALHDALGKVSERIEILVKEKADKSTVHDMVSLKADAYDVAHKADIRVFDAVDRSLRNVIAEMGDLRTLHEDEIDRVKAAMEKYAMKTLKTLFYVNSESNKHSFLATRSLCLSCGRSSLVKSVADPSQPTNFLPALGNNATPGPDVFRGGFRMPFHTKEPILTPIQYPSPNKSMQEYDDARTDAPLAIEASQEESASTKVKSRQLKVISHGNGRDEVQQIRPMYRKGLKGQKSDRASVMFSAEKDEPFRSVSATSPSDSQSKYDSYPTPPNMSMSKVDILKAAQQRPKFLPQGPML